MLEEKQDLYREEGLRWRELVQGGAIGGKEICAGGVWGEEALSLERGRGRSIVL